MHLCSSSGVHGSSGILSGSDVHRSSGMHGSRTFAVRAAYTAAVDSSVHGSGGVHSGSSMHSRSSNDVQNSS